MVLYYSVLASQVVAREETLFPNSRRAPSLPLRCAPCALVRFQRGDRNALRAQLDTRLEGHSPQDAAALHGASNARDDEGYL